MIYLTSTVVYACMDRPRESNFVIRLFYEYVAYSALAAYIFIYIAAGNSCEIIYSIFLHNIVSGKKLSGIFQLAFYHRLLKIIVCDNIYTSSYFQYVPSSDALLTTSVAFLTNYIKFLTTSVIGQFLRWVESFVYQNATFFSLKKKYSLINEIMGGEKGDKSGE